MRRIKSSDYTGCVKVNSRPVNTIVHTDGVTYIEGRKGSEYELSFTNNSYSRVLVIPSVDGLSTLDGKPAGNSSPGYVVKANSTLDIPGWAIDNTVAAKFVFWPQDARGEATYVEELDRMGARVDTGNQGMIGFLVIREHIEYAPIMRTTFGSPWTDPSWSGTPVGGILHSASAETVTCSASNDAGMGTKFGDATEFRTTTTEFNRGPVAQTIVLEYDTLRGLKDRGVDVSALKNDSKNYGKRSAFPNDEQSGCVIPDNWQSNHRNKTNDELRAAFDAYRNANR